MVRRQSLLCDQATRICYFRRVCVPRAAGGIVPAIFRRRGRRLSSEGYISSRALWRNAASVGQMPQRPKLPRARHARTTPRTHDLPSRGEPRTSSTRGPALVDFTHDFFRAARILAAINSTRLRPSSTSTILALSLFVRYTKSRQENHTCKITCKNLVLAVLWRPREVPDGL